MKATRILFIGLCCLIPLVGFGQVNLKRTFIGSEGGFTQAGNLRLAWSIGEPMVSVNSVSIGIGISEGFQQPLPLLAAPLSDSIWPGDANHDGAANNFDLLAIGLAYGATGPIRPGANLNWTGQWAPNWNDSLGLNLNYKHIDTDGNGSINADDTLAILLNYGLTHNRGGSGSSSGPPLYVEFEEDSLVAGDTAYVLVKLGTDTAVAEDFYGIGFQLEFDTSFVDHDTVFVSYDNSWFGIKNVNMLSLSKYHLTEGKLDMAMVGIDQNDRSGFGTLARVGIIMIDDLARKTDPGEWFRLTINNPVTLNSLNESIEVSNPAIDSVFVIQPTTHVPALSQIRINLYPNPAQQYVSLEIKGTRGNGYQLTDALGRNIKSSLLPFKQTQIQLNHVPNGMYLLRIFTSAGTISRKVYVQR